MLPGYHGATQVENTMFLVVLLYALFASIFVIAKEALLHSSPFFLVGSRMLVAGFILLGYRAATHGLGVFRLSSHIMGKMFLLGLFNIYMTNVFEFWGLQYLSPAKTCFIYSLTPFISALLSYLILSETVSRKKGLGLAVGFLGFIPILMNQGAYENLSGHVTFLSWAEISVICAACSTVYGWIVMRELVSEKGICPVTANGWSMLFGGALATMNSYLIEDWSPVPVTDFVPFLEATALMIIISSLVCYNLYGFLLKRYTVTFLSFAGFMTPMFTALFEWLWFGEVVSYAFIVSAVIVLTGLVLFYQEELREEGIHTQTV